MPTNGIWLEAPKEAFGHLGFPFSGVLSVEGVFSTDDPRGFRGRIRVDQVIEHKHWQGVR